MFLEIPMKNCIVEMLFTFPIEYHISTWFVVGRLHLSITIFFEKIALVFNSDLDSYSFLALHFFLRFLLFTVLLDFWIFLVTDLVINLPQLVWDFTVNSVQMEFVSIINKLSNLLLVSKSNKLRMISLLYWLLIYLSISVPT